MPFPRPVPSSSTAVSRRLHRLVLVGGVACALVAPALQARSDGPITAPQAVRRVDLQRYSGRWYELARLPNSFQRNCALDVTADYTLAAADRLRVVNQCTRRDGTVDMSTGIARQAAGASTGPGDGPGEGALQLRFAPRWLSWWPAVWGDYWILALDDGYDTALVGTPDRAYLWLLSRSPQRPEADIAAWLQKAADLGYPVDRMVRTAQDEPALLLASPSGAPGVRAAVQPEADWSEPAAPVLPAPVAAPAAPAPAQAAAAPPATPAAPASEGAASAPAAAPAP